MFRWIPYTFVRIAFFFVAGILCGIWFPDAIAENLARVTLVFLTALYLFLYLFSRLSRRTVFNPGWLGLSAIFLFGYVHLLSETASRDPRHFGHAPDEADFYEVVIASYPEEKARTWKQEARVTAVHAHGWQARRGQVVLYFSKSDFDEPFRYGDRLLIHGAPAKVNPPANPGEFDYRRFLNFRNIYHQHFLRDGQVRRLGNDPPSIVMKYAVEARQWATAVIEKYVNGDREQATASALVLGVTDGLDNELLDAYSATGSMHVLAVSGLHISILYMIIVWVLHPLRKTRAGRWVLAIAGLVLLWAYAFVTGLSPSVLRAVMMFSFIALARPTGQHTNIYNTLASSAFCLLLVDPFLVMSVGFQLSYLAVLAIVFIHPRLYRLWEAPGWFTDQIWKITSVSVAAQLGTFVLGLLYFHQFPNYFLISNLLVIPVSFVVLVSGVVLLAVSMVPFLGPVVGWVLTMSVKLLNGAVFAVESFPFNVTKDIHIDIFQCWALLGIVVSAILLLEFRRFRYLWVMFFLVVVFAALQWNHFRDAVAIRKLTVYSVYGHSAIDFFDRGHAWCLSDSALRVQPDKVGYHIQPNRMFCGIEEISLNAVPFAREVPGGMAVVWSGMKIARLMTRQHVLPAAEGFDLIVVSNNAVADFRAFAEQYQGTTIVLDSSNGYYYATKFMEVVAGAGTRVHSVLHEGAFELVISEE